ncbi:hypothetical protein F1D05_10640 [Kribbella qitaiheensis]|uniref:Uncharacterized protein n=2 Tax=Kribbella qitaiheensis TaxID=1544730 RepID=A0A7G6X9F7_9ACTN|nr:hypothetical protein F1D05_10640 [Kribbella qitaiheensis]
MPITVDPIRRFYGAHPLHAMVLLGCFALTGYVALQVVTDASWPKMAAWFVGAVIAHDLVLFPLYTLADRTAQRTLRFLPRRPSTHPHPSALNYLRVPALAAGLVLLLFFPGITKQGHDTYLAATGQDQHPYLARWLLLTAVFFTLSTLLYTLRLVHAARGRATAD